MKPRRVCVNRNMAALYPEFVYLQNDLEAESFVAVGSKNNYILRVCMYKHKVFFLNNVGEIYINICTFFE